MPLWISNYQRVIQLKVCLWIDNNVTYKYKKAIHL